MFLLLAACNEEAPAPEGEVPTWSEDVAPILAGSCGSCHVEGGVAPFPLDSYAAAAPMASSIVDAVESGRMPPWSAEATDECQPRFGWKDDLRLSWAEKETLRAWSEGGAPEGEAADSAPLPEPPELALTGANQELFPATPFEAAGETDQFRCFVLDPGLTETAWLTGAQIVPDNDEVVHHVLVFADENRESEALADADGGYDCFGGPGVNGALLAAWAPGAVPFEVPEGSGVEVDAGSLLVMQVHYHPAGGAAEPDASIAQLRWITEEPENLAVLALVGNASSQGEGLHDGPNDPDGVPVFQIPAGASGHTESMSFQIPVTDGPYTVFAVGTHMHYIGTDMKITVEHLREHGVEPEDECLIQTPRWDFNWQRAYSYDAPLEEVPVIRGGDTLRLDCVYDNTLDNPGVVQALEDAGLTEPQDVVLGEETLDEMCLGVFGIVY